MGRRIAILFNERAGRGRAAICAADTRLALEGAGHAVESIGVGQNPEQLDAEALIVVGGDGTLHRALPLVLRLDIAVYHVPLGTENLIPREFGFRIEPDAIVRAVDAWEIRRVDLGFCGDTPFAIMASVGFDANVIHRMHTDRNARIRRTTYLLPILAELLHGESPRVSILADGEALVDNKAGVVIVANCRQYGFRFDPAPQASMTDGLLDVVFMPAANRRQLVAWGVRARLGRLPRSRAIVCRPARVIEIEIDRPEAAYQMDGEAYRVEGSSMATAGGENSPAKSRLDFSVRAGALAMLMPA